MLTNEKETMLNKVLQFEQWFYGYWEAMPSSNMKDVQEQLRLYENIKRNLNSIKSLINKS